MRFTKYLDELTKVKGFRTVKDIADFLGVTGPAVSQYRSGSRSPENELCIKIAIALNADPTEIIMAADLDRADREGKESAWTLFLNRTKAAALAILLAACVTNFLTPTDANAATARLSEQATDRNINYAKSRRQRKALLAVLAWLERLLVRAALQPAAL